MGTRNRWGWSACWLVKSIKSPSFYSVAAKDTWANTFGPVVQSLPSVYLVCLNSGIVVPNEDNKHQREQLMFTRETETSLWRRMDSFLTS